MAVFADPGLELFGLGARLREARIRSGLELADAERATCIRAANLAAIEDERFDALPADVYAAGFVRAYAEFLGLDGEALAQRFRDARTHEPPEVVHEWLERPRRRGRRPLLAAAAAVVLAAGGAAAYLLLPASPPAPARPPAQRLPVVRVRAPLVVRATGGDVWVSVHFDRAHGKLVWQGTLRQGRQLRFGLDRPLWVGVGDPLKATVTAHGEPLPPRPAFLGVSPQQ